MLWPVWLSWTSSPTRWKVTSLIPTQGTCPGCRFSPRSGHMGEATDWYFLSHWCSSPSFSPSLPLSLKINLKFFFKGFIHYLFLEWGEGKEIERGRNSNVWLPLTHRPLGTQPATQASAPTRNSTGNSPPPTCCSQSSLNPLSHTSWGSLCNF